MNKILTVLASAIALPYLSSAQSYPPPAGQPGSTAIHKDSSVIVGWATTCTVERGYMDVTDPSLGYASFGTESAGAGPASGITTSVVSLGDGGTATLTFSSGIANGPGADFVVFENGLNDTFLELAFVEVSSDGAHFVRFPAVSEIPSDVQVGSFGSVDCRYIHNFAGKYRVGYGTPFDLEDLIDSTGIDLDAITHVRLVDIIGTIDPAYATYDSQGNITNDPYPTPFESGGFDLDGVGVINTGTLSLKTSELTISVFPNPVSSVLTVQTTKNDSFSISNVLGETIIRGEFTPGNNQVCVTQLTPGIYFMKTQAGDCIKFVRE